MEVSHFEEIFAGMVLASKFYLGGHPRSSKKVPVSMLAAERRPAHLI